MYLFSFNDAEDFGFLISIVDKDYFDEHGCLSDHDLGDELWNVLPNCLHEVMESTFETTASKEETRIRLIAAGLVESNELFDFIESLSM